jgi:hypothetical protein
MRNKIEILRAIEFTKDDLNNIVNLDEFPEFTIKDREFMEEFKKVYELGLNQLEKFINKLDLEGSELDVYSIRYYVTQLLTGPLGSYAKELSKDKKYFRNIPDIMGRCGNIEVTNSNVTIVPNTSPPLGQTVDVYNKLPIFLQDLSVEASTVSENVFRVGMIPTSCIDNTLPLIDKKTQQRVNTEDSGSWQSQAHGTNCVRDRYFYNVLKEINSDIFFKKVKNYLQDENFRIFYDKKSYNSFDESKNTSTASNSTVVLSSNGELIETDLMGDVYDSFNRRKSTLKLQTESKNVEYELSTNIGQLGIKK